MFDLKWCQMFNLLALERGWACFCATRDFTCTQTHKHGCCSSNLLCLQSGHQHPHHHHWSRPAPQKTGRAQPNGQVRNPQVSERNRQKKEKSRLYLNTDLRALSCEQKIAAVHPEDSLSLTTLQSPGSPDLNQAAPNLAVDRPGLLWGGTDHKSIIYLKTWMQHCNKQRKAERSVLTSPVWWTLYVPPGSSQPQCPSLAARSRVPRWGQNWPFHAPVQDTASHTDDAN